MAKKDFLKEYHKKRNFKITAEPFGVSTQNKSVLTGRTMHQIKLDAQKK